jgi:ribosomal protein S6
VLVLACPGGEAPVGEITKYSGDIILISKDGLRKLKFDIKNQHRDGPHLHLRVFRNGKWRDAIKENHRIHSKED